MRWRRMMIRRKGLGGREGRREGRVKHKETKRERVCVSMCVCVKIVSPENAAASHFMPHSILSF